MNIRELLIPRYTVEAEAQRIVADTLTRWAHNPDCLRAAVAGQLGIDPSHVRDDSMLLAPMSRAIVAFADKLREEKKNAVEP